MCYMGQSKKRVGIRELRQNLSVYLQRVTQGQRLEVTDRGRVVAVLAPSGGLQTPGERLVAQGRARPAAGDLLKLGPPPSVRLRRPLSAVLEEIRGDRL